MSDHQGIGKRVLFEDNHLIAVNKLSSEIVQGDETGDRTLAEDVKSYLKEVYSKPGNVFLGIPHRLDRPSSGAVLFTKTDKALSRISVMFKERRIRKIYWAVFDSTPPETEGELVHHLVRDSSKNKSFAYDKKRGDSKEARLTYRLIGATKNYFLVEIELITGRHHQIRAQFAKAGCRIKGDLKYGSPRSNRGGGIHLHARRLEFIHPVTEKPVIIEAPAPDEALWNVFRSI